MWLKNDTLASPQTRGPMITHKIRARRKMANVFLCYKEWHYKSECKFLKKNKENNGSSSEANKNRCYNFWNKFTWGSLCFGVV